MDSLDTVDTNVDSIGVTGLNEHLSLKPHTATFRYRVRRLTYPSECRTQYDRRAHDMYLDVFSTSKGRWFNEDYILRAPPIIYTEDHAMHCFLNYSGLPPCADGRRGSASPRSGSIYAGAGRGGVPPTESLKDLETFITINPKGSIPVMDFVNRINSILKWSIFISGVYVYEQRGTSMLNNGLHCHLLVVHKHSRKKLKDLLVRNLVSKFCGNRQHIDFQYAKSMPSEEFYSDHVEYIQGNKFKEQDDRHEDDKTFRVKYNLKDYYEF